MKTKHYIYLPLIALLLTFGIRQGLAMSKSPADLNDLQIAHVAYTADNIDIRYAHLAMAISDNPEIHGFAQAMIRDHNAAVLATPVYVLGEPKDPGYVFSVTVSSSQQLDVVLDRAEDLRALFNPEEHSKIAIVLHGDELQLFQKGNYSINPSVIERARLLDQDNIIDIKACQTMMRVLDIDQNELPSFIEQVPFAPAEIERLQKEEGFTRL